MKKNLIFFFTIILIASFLRLWQIGSVPYGFANDEMNIVYNGYTIWKTGGFDVNGNFLPLSINVDSSLSPVPIYLVSPFVGILNAAPFSARLPFVILGIGSVILVYLITKEILNNKPIALLSSFVLTVSPWHLLISRGAWDGGVALFFYLLGIYIFVKKVNKGNINWSLIPFLLAFYSYHGTKIFYLFFIPILLLIYREDLLKRKKELIIFLTGFIFIIISFLFVVKTQKVMRQEVFFWNDIVDASKAINYEREKSTAPNILKEFYSNKPIYFFNTVSRVYLESFSVSHLFIYGDRNKITGYGRFLDGSMYLVELPLLIFGVFYFLKRASKRSRNLIFTGLIVAPLPSAMAGDNGAYIYTIRSIMMLPFLSILVGSGIYFLFSYFKSHYKVLKFAFLIVLILSYSFFISKNLYKYYFQFSTSGAEAWFKSSRELSEYIGKNHSKYDRVYIVGIERMFFLQYGFFNKIDIETIKKAWFNQDLARINNIEFSGGCFYKNGTDDPDKFLKEKELYIVPDRCQKDYEPKSKITDSEESLITLWKFYEKP